MRIVLAVTASVVAIVLEVVVALAGVILAVDLGAKQS